MKKRKMIIMAVLLIMAGLLHVEIKPYEIHHSTVFTSGNSVEIKLCVIANSWLPIDENTLAKEIVENHTKINGARENTIYELEIYRTNIHYRQNWRYDTLFCDENGNIVPRVF